jgi:outer membrane protein assembly factor BamB
MMLVIPHTTRAAGPTIHPWPSFRHDLLNSGAATDSGYPDTLNVLWSQNREERSFLSGPAGARGPIVVDKGMVFTAGTGVIQANDQFTGNLVWSKYVLWKTALTGIDVEIHEPAGAPTDWCYNDIPAIEGNTGKCYTTGDCPSWCFECTDVEPDCVYEGHLSTGSSLIAPLNFATGYDQFLTGPTLDPSYGVHGSVIFGTFDGRVISLDMSDGTTIWERTPYKDPGGPNDGAPWYNQKYAWHLSPPAIANGKVYIGSFLPSFYAIFRPWAFVTPGQPGYPWPHIGNDATHYWVGRDGYFYSLDEDDGSIDWTWAPRGCGVTNIPPVKDGKVFIEADTATDYHYGYFATLNADTGEEVWHVGTIPLAQGGTQAILGNTIYTPGGDGALWALDVDTGQVQWTHWAGFNVRGHTALCSAPAVDETNGWVIGIADTGRMFVLDKDTGRVVKEAFLGLDSWNVFDPHPDSGYWLPGPSGVAISPADGLLYVAGTDYDRAWLGTGTYGREKLFCYDYVTDPNTLILKWEYQFCTEDNCAIEDNEYIVRGHGPYVVAWYSVPSPALVDGHVYYSSTNGKIYCFGADFATDDTDGDGAIDYRDNCPAIHNPGQEDADGDLVGDACDTCNDTADFDNICVGDICPSAFDPNQEDTYPPQGNGIGDACDCESDFNCDGNVDAIDVDSFLDDFGRSTFFQPCTNDDPCNGDFDCNVNVDANDVSKFLEDFGRSQFFNPCPACVAGAWCSY